ncbi:MAG: 3-oxoacyl-ACP synthase [Flavobacteriales bacterium]|nr:MAG: 3-oxoacyl-ACP synthase [Flavobacteriales bacterium]
MAYRTIITGLGHYVPERVVSNNELAEVIDTSDEWITERTGIKERRWFKPGFDRTSNMGTKAALMAIENAGLIPNDIDFIIFATLSPDYNFPGCGVLVQKELGIKEVGALDVRTQCTGFVYGVSIADQYIKTGMYKTILVIGSEIQSNVFDLSDKGRDLAVIFGDGAGAAVLQVCEDENRGVLSTHLHSEGQYAEELCLLEPGSRHAKRIDMETLTEENGIWPYMNGRQVFKHAVVRFVQIINEALEANGLKPEDLDLIIPHQANLRISEAVRAHFELPKEKFYNNIQKYGNTTAASIPLALSEAWREGKVKEGDLICLASFGSGFTWASTLIRW